MDIEWTFALPTDEKSADYQYESPIFVKNGEVYFIECHGRGMCLHVIDAYTGEEKARYALAWSSVLPRDCFFEEYGSKVIIYTGELWVYENGELAKLCQSIQSGKNILGHIL